MAKFFKVCLVIGLICIGVGIAASAAGVSLGGLSQLKDQVLQGEWTFNWENITGEQAPFFELDKQEYFDHNAEVYENSARQESSFAVDEIQAIHVKTSGITVKFMTHNGNEILVYAAKTGKFQNYIKEQELVITATGQNTKELGEGLVEILIPETLCNAAVLDVDVEASACVIDLGMLALDEVDLEVSAGTVSWKQLEAEALSLEMAAGAVKGSSTSILQQTDIKMHAGSVEISGSLGTETELEIMAGKISMKLTNAYTDFNYDISCAGGSVILGEEEVQGLGKEFKKNHNASNDMDIECSAGVVEISFE